MMSETAFFVKDVIGPKGSVSIVLAEGVVSVKSDDINAHTQTNQILHHHAALAPDGTLARPRRPALDHGRTRPRRPVRARAALPAEGDRRGPRSVRAHGRRGQSLRIVLAADQSVRTGRVMTLF